MKRALGIKPATKKEKTTKETFELQARCDCGKQVSVKVDQFADVGYVRWIISVTCSKYTKDGLENFVDEEAKTFYELIIKPKLKDSPNCKCKLTDEMSNKVECQKSDCTVEALKAALLENKSKPCWKNIDMNSTKSSNEISKLFLQTETSRSYTGPESADAAALLHIIKGCGYIRRKLQDDTTIDPALDSRNEIMHSSDMSLTEKQFNAHMDNFSKILKSLPEKYKEQQRYKEAIENIAMIRERKDDRSVLIVVERQALDQKHKFNLRFLKDIKDQMKSATGKALKGLKKILKQHHLHESKRVAKLCARDVPTDAFSRHCEDAEELYTRIEDKQDEEEAGQYTRVLTDVCNSKEVMTMGEPEKKKGKRDTTKGRKSASTPTSIQVEGQMKVKGEFNPELTDKKSKEHAAIKTQTEQALQKVVDDGDDKETNVEVVIEDLTCKPGSILMEYIATFKGTIENPMTIDRVKTTVENAAKTKSFENFEVEEDSVRIEEYKLDFTNKLKNQTVTETGTVTLECQLSKANKTITWMKDGKQLLYDGRITVTADRFTHRITIKDVTLKDAGKFQCYCGKGRTFCTLKVKEIAPVFTKELTNQTVEETGAVKLECQLSKPNKPVQWTKDGKQLLADGRITVNAEKFSHRIIIKDVTLEDAGKFRCVCGHIKTKCTLAVKELAPVFTKELTNQTVEETGAVKLECRLSKANKPVHWTKDGKQLLPDSRIAVTAVEFTHRLSIKDVVLEDAGKFRCVCGNVDTDCTVVVQEIAPVFTKELTNHTVEETQAVKLECQLSKPSKPVQWTKDGKQLLPGSRITVTADKFSYRITIKDVTLEDAGKFRCVCGNVKTKCTLAVKELSPAFTKELTNQTVTETGTVTLECQLSKANKPVLWTKDGKQLLPNDRISVTAVEFIHLLSIKDVTLEDAGKFRCVCGNVDTDCTVVVQELAPVFSKDLTNQTVEETRTVTLECQLSKANKPVQWTKDGKPLLSDGRISVTAVGFTHRLSIEDVTLKDAGKFRCVCGNVGTDCTLVVKELAPAFTKKLANQTVAETRTVTLECQLSKANKPVQWTKDGKPLLSDGRISVTAVGFNHRLSIEDVTMEDAGNFRCVCGNVGTDCTLVVKELAPTFTKELANQTVEETGTVILECKLSKPNKPVQWTKDGKQLLPDGRISVTAVGLTHRLSIKDVTLKDAGKFRCFCGNVKTKCTLVVKELFTMKLTNQTVEETRTVTLECQLSNANKPVQWTQDSKQLFPDGRISVTAVGLTHRLSIKVVTMEDAGKFRCVCGNVNTKCTLAVKELFTKKLTNQTVEETGMVTLECQLSNANTPVEWTKDGKQLLPDGRISVTAVGLTHRLNIKDVTLEDAGKFRCVCGNVKTKCTLVVKELFTKKLTNQTVEETGTVSLKCQLSNANKPVQWTKDGKQLLPDGRISVTAVGLTYRLSIKDVTLEDAGNFRCVCGNVNTKCTLAVKELFTKKLTNQTVEETGTVSLKCQLSNANKPVQWTKDGKQLLPDGRISVTAVGLTYRLSIKDVTLEDAGIFRCVCGNVNTKCTLAVKELFTKQLTNQNVEETGMVTLECQLSNANTPVQWTKDGKQLLPDGRISVTAVGLTHRLSIKDVTLEDAGKFRCVCGNVNTKCTLVVKELFKKKLTNQTVEETGTVTLECKLSKAHTPVQWTKDGKQLLPDARISVTAVGFSHRLRIKDVTLEDAGKFRCACDNVDTDCTVVVQELVSAFTKKLANQTVAETRTVTLECQLSKANKPVQWTKDGKPLLSDGRISVTAVGFTHRLSIEDVTLKDAGKFRCVCGNVGTDCTLVVKELAPVFTKELTNQIVEETGAVKLECQMSTANKPVKWTKDGKQLLPDSRITLAAVGLTHRITIKDVTMKDAGKFRCVCGNVKTKCTLAVKELPVQFVKPLEDTQGYTKFYTTLSCELSIPNQTVTWTKQGQVVSANRNLNIVSGIYTHQLVFSQLAQDEMGKYTCSYRDVTTTAFLTVQDDDDQASRLLQFRIEDTWTKSAEEVRKVVLEKGIIQQLTLMIDDLSSLGDQLSDVLTLQHLMELHLGGSFGITLSHEQCQNLGRYLRGSPQLRMLSLISISCTTDGEESGCGELDLGGPLRLHAIRLEELSFTRVVFNPELLLRCYIRLPDNGDGQVSTLHNLLAAWNLQKLTFWNVNAAAAVSKLVDVLPQLHGLQQLTLDSIDFGSVTDIRLSATMDQLERVVLWKCKFDPAGLECLLQQHNLPQRRVEISLTSVTIRGEEDVISKIRQSPDTEVERDYYVEYRGGGWRVGDFTFYTQK